MSPWLRNRTDVLLYWGFYVTFGLRDVRPEIFLTHPLIIHITIMDKFFSKGSWLLFASVMMLASCGGNAGRHAEGVKDADTAVVNGVKTLRLDGMTVTWIQDNAQEKLMPRTLFADVPDSIIGKLSLQEGVPSSVSTFLVETEGIKILFDTGLGAPDSRLSAGLESVGLKPADIDYLYLTHFHGDHIGGMLRNDTAVFPNAEVYAGKAEYDAWMQMPDGQKAQVVKTMGVYGKRLHLFEFGDTLPGRVTAVDASGHTPGHTAFRVGNLMVVGDLVHGAALQIPYPQYCAAYDMEKGKSVETRRQILEYVKDNGLVMAGMHLPAPALVAEQ